MLWRRIQQASQMESECSRPDIMVTFFPEDVLGTLDQVAVIGHLIPRHGIGTVRMACACPLPSICEGVEDYARLSLP